MPALRLSTRRRRSSISFSPAKAGIYGIPRPVTFAPNVTPVSYIDEDTSPTTSDDPSSLTNTLFPPSATPAPPPARKRCPPGKRRSMGYIPRPPNAFMLFRADFVRQKHVPGSIETNHGSLSKIIGNCWRALPLDEKRVWEVRAKHAKAEHKTQYPEYKFRPVHNKNKDKSKKDKPVVTVDDERRCEEVAQLLLEGKKGEELAAAVRDLDSRTSGRDTPVSVPLYFHQQEHRRSSSVPLPNDYYPTFNGIALPSVPFLPTSRPPSPVSTIARHMHQQQQYNHLGHRRSSSAGAMFAPHHHHQSRSWTMPAQPHPGSLQRDHSPLPEVDTSLFNPSFQLESPLQESPFDVSGLLAGLPAASPHDTLGPHINLGPLDPNLGPLDNFSQGPMQQFPDAMNWLTPSTAYSEASTAYSESSTAYSESSTAYSESSTGYSAASTPFDSTPFSHDPSAPFHGDTPFSHADDGSPTTTSPYTPPSACPSLPLHQPKPHTPTAAAFSDMWKDVGGDAYGGLNMDGNAGYAGEFESLFEPMGTFDAGYTAGVGGAGYEYNDGMNMMG